MKNLTKEARMTYIAANFIEQTKEQLHAPETEIQVERGIYDKFVE